MRISHKKIRASLFTLTVIGSIIFVVLLIVGMITYSGGNRFNSTEPHYSFSENYLSELGAINTYSGRINVTSRILFATAVLIGGIGLVIFYYNVAFLFRDEPTRTKVISKLASFFGIISSLMCVSIAFLPIDVFKIAHRICVYIFGLLVLPAQILFAIVIFLDRNYPNFYGWLYSVFAVILTVYILMNIIIKFDAPYEQEVVKIIGQKLVIFLNAFNIALQAIGARALLLQESKLGIIEEYQFIP